MLLLELTNQQLHNIVASGYQTVKQDNSTPDLSSLRKSRLTLAQIKRLRRWSDARNAEHKLKLAKLRNQYVYIPPKGL